MLRFLILATILAVSGITGCGAEEATKQKPTSKWVEDNDLWKEDGLYLAENVSEKMFNDIISAAEKIYEPIAKEWKEQLVINRNWDDPTVNANAWRNGRGDTEINMYGGLARRPEVVPMGFALVLCHELNHLYGGTPYINPLVKMSAEGQADFSGAGWCLKNIVETVADESEIEITEYMKTTCGEDNRTCLRQLAGGFSLGKLLAVLKEETIPSFETPDKTVVTRTNTSYPKTIQCRLDSYHNGALGKDRPLCWYKP